MRGACFVLFPPAFSFPSRNNPGCIVRVGAQVRRIIGTTTTLDFVVYALGWGNEASRFLAVDGPALRRTDLRNAGEKGEMGLEFGALLIDGSSSSAGGRWGCWGCDYWLASTGSGMRWRWFTSPLPGTWPVVVNGPL